MRKIERELHVKKIFLQDLPYYSSFLPCNDKNVEGITSSIYLTSSSINVIPYMIRFGNGYWFLPND